MSEVENIVEVELIVPGIYSAPIVSVYVTTTSRRVCVFEGDGRVDHDAAVEIRNKYLQDVNLGNPFQAPRVQDVEIKDHGHCITVGARFVDGQERRLYWGQSDDDARAVYQEWLGNVGQEADVKG